ncbi:hypothetical protein CDL12_12310 [Handroanthus impetiginosus]|uniref:Uncharacterized protein n=1 Tax=Handroanthus impetiginosus TaxID=429701 RepID=A0A2G9HBX6_9LAMI|nr:hypothetical protein CDL12_12310 [Handroanthus impetiginosus]
MVKKMSGGVVEVAPPAVVFPRKPSHPPKLETIREDAAEEREEECVFNDLNFDLNLLFQHCTRFLSGLPRKLVRGKNGIILGLVVLLQCSLQKLLP